MVGAEGWSAETATIKAAQHRGVTGTADKKLIRDIVDACEPFSSLETADLNPLLERIGDARLVLIGEASHGTSEFYRLRSRISSERIAKKGFNFVAIEGDWPDAAGVDLPRGIWR